MVNDSPESAALKRIIEDFHWMARRYADGRMSYAVSLFNDCTRKALDLGCELNPTADGTIWARDGMGVPDGSPPPSASEEERLGPLPGEVVKLRRLVSSILEKLRHRQYAVDLWCRVQDVTGLERQAARDLCREFGLNPDESRFPDDPECLS